MGKLQSLRTVAGIICMLLGASVSAEQSAPKSQETQLKFVLILTRHGVRSPTWTNERLNAYAKDPWPSWSVAPGMLTAHGRALMTSFGGYYREYFASQGLLSPKGCLDAKRAYFLADTDERTIETGRALSEGLFPECSPEVHAKTAGRDALFHPIGEIGQPDSALAAAALMGHIGGDASALLPALNMQMQMLQHVLFDCAACTVAGKESVLQIPASIKPGSDDHLVTMKGPIPTGATFAENFQLEYLEGMPDAQVGWGRVDERTMQALMAIHSTSSDLFQRTTYIARAQASNLLAHIDKTLEQARLHEPVLGAVGSPEDKIIFLVGHDTNLSNVAALLDAHWLISGYQRDDAAPGGALVFELWHQDGRADLLRVYYVVQTPDQMRNSVALSLQSPPARTPLLLPRCDTAGQDKPCSAEAFSRMVQQAIDPSFVK